MRYTVEPISIARATLVQFAEYVLRQLTRIAQALVNPDSAWAEDLIDLSTVHAPASNPPTWTKIKDNGAGSAGVSAWLFNNATEQSLEFSWSAPRSREDGTGIKPVIRFSPNGNNAGTIVWGLEYTVSNPDGTFGNTSIVYASLAVAANAQLDHLVAKWAEIDGSSIAMGASFICRVFRATGHGSHTLTDNCFGIECGFNTLRDRLGSELEYVKRVEG